MNCTCSHRAIVHRYVTATRSNQGECLAGGCGCAGFEEGAENPLGMGGLSVAAWDNGGTNTDGPGPAALTAGSSQGLARRYEGAPN